MKLGSSGSVKVNEMLGESVVSTHPVAFCTSDTNKDPVEHSAVRPDQTSTVLVASFQSNGVKNPVLLLSKQTVSVVSPEAKLSTEVTGSEIPHNDPPKVTSWLGSGFKKLISKSTHSPTHISSEVEVKVPVVDGFTDTSMSSVAVQPLSSVVVTVYVPPSAEVTLGIDKVLLGPD